MSKHILICFFALFAVSASAAKGADGGNGSDGGSTNHSSGRAGCPGGTDPDENGNFYLPGTKEECNPGSQDAAKTDNPLLLPR
ncbi:hypothetical protein ACMSX5_001008 [Cronobacter turicensis]|uniref:hypothetical protein n=1 Tax=Cronobacter turicensis TaxID=413502 RepID=UPI0008FF9293|nr:hypothetical protein [Cronobacter turicensis]ELY5851175.1 hypothetical protein [Cronobacter turicensis]EMD9176401.1 hypothetical protein [Cronobacter turicensis]MDI6472287.1 hypothetical protein [Cronobacter turicensis]MDK1183644.1 hypothetical protein [Cronobacter turicensis]MDK1207093.1 hypothetical protein [Cronobacter turicensis]